MDQMVKMAMIVIESMPLKSGFALVELIIGLVILSIAGLIVVPAYNQQMYMYEQKKIISHLDAVVAYGWMRALQTGHTHRVLFRLKEGTVSLQMEKTNQKKEIEYETIPLYFSASDLHWPSYYEIQNFYIDGQDDFTTRSAGKEIDDIWFFIYPRGHTQSIVINILNTRYSQHREMSLVLNPFMLQYEVHDAFSKA